MDVRGIQCFTWYETSPKIGYSSYETEFLNDAISFVSTGLGDVPAEAGFFATYSVALALPHLRMAKLHETLKMSKQLARAP